MKLVRLGDPLMACDTNRVPTLSREEEGQWVGLRVKSSLGSDRGASQGFLYIWGLSLNLSLKPETVNEEVRVNIAKEIQAILRLYKEGQQIREVGLVL